MDKITLFGHGVFGGDSGVILNIELALIPLFLLYIMRWMKKDKLRKKLAVAALFAVFVLFLPNTMYLGLEVKHLLLDDAVAQPADKTGIISSWAYLAFWTMGAFGWMINIHCIRIASRNPVVQTLLCFASAFGTTLGLTELNSYEAFVDPIKVLARSLQVMHNDLWMQVTWALFGILMCAWLLTELLVYFVTVPAAKTQKALSLT